VPAKVGILVRDVSHYKRRTDKPAAKWHSSVLLWLKSHRIKHWNVLFIFTQLYEVITPLNDTLKYCLLHVKHLCLLHQVFMFLFYVCHTSTFLPLRNEKLRTLNWPSKASGSQDLVGWNGQGMWHLWWRTEMRTEFWWGSLKETEARCKWDDNIKIDFNTRLDGVHCIYLAQETDTFLAPAKVVL